MRSAAFVLAALVSSLCPAAGYRITPIPMLAHTSQCAAYGINGYGIIVGTCDARAWMYDNHSKALTELTFDPAAETMVAVAAVSNSGVIVGYFDDPKYGGPTPAYWTVTGGAATLASPPWCLATGVNATGTIVASCETDGFPGEGAYSWRGTNYTTGAPLPTLRCDHCNFITVNAMAVNDAGVIVGASEYNVGALDVVHAVEWVKGRVIDLARHDTFQSQAMAVNNAPHPLIVGEANGHAATWVGPGSERRLTRAPGTAFAVNYNGTIVGTVTTPQGRRAFLYQGGRTLDLTSLAKSKQILVEATGINARGSITANSSSRAYLLTVY